MEPSSQAQNEQPVPDTAPGSVNSSELYDGPRVVPLASGRGAFIPHADPSALLAPVPQPQMSPIADVKSEYPALIVLALDVLSARLLGLIALVTACVVWAGVIYDPEMWRIVAAGTFSILVFLPAMALYWRAGMTGEGEDK